MDLPKELQEVLPRLVANDPTLTELDLRYNNIGDEGAKALGLALQINTTLTTLYLLGNNIGVEGESAIFNALEYNITLTDLAMDFRSDSTRQKMKAILEGNKQQTRPKKTPPTQANQDEAIKKDLDKSDQVTKVTTNTKQKQTLPTYNGSDIKSRDELLLIHQYVEKEFKAALIFVQDHFESEEGITNLENVKSRLEHIKKAISNSALLSIDQLKLEGDCLEEQLKLNLETINQEQNKALEVFDFKKLKECASKARALQVKKEEQIKDAEAKYNEAKKSLETRHQALITDAGAVPNTTSAPLSGDVNVEGLDKSRSIIKNALESASSHQGIPQRVTLDYLACLTQNWSEHCILGRGGQGKVYRGYDERLNCTVAIKQVLKLGKLEKGTFEREIMVSTFKLLNREYNYKES